MAFRPKRCSNSRAYLGVGAMLTRRRSLSASPAAGGLLHRKLDMAPRKLVMVACESRISPQNFDTEKRRDSTTDAPHTSAAPVAASSALLWKSGRQT
jgi:hypothetical protein